jgi:phage terminase large subunit-like protein
LQYAQDVHDGRIPVGHLAMQAVQRHFDDVEKDNAGTFRFTIDFPAGERMLRAMQMFRHVKGPLAGRRMKLEPWQLFVFGSLFWWVDRETRFRRFRQAFVAVPRGNGKSATVSALALCMLALDGEAGAEVYSAATTRDQARIVFDTARLMAQREPDFLRRFGIEVARHSIIEPGGAAIFKPLSRDASTLDGLNVHFAVLDEVAQHKSGEVFSVLQTALGKRAQPLMLCITTAGSDQSGIGYQQWRYTERVLDGSVTDERFFGIIYAADPEDDWKKPETWIKANPNWGVSVFPDMIESLAQRAAAVPSEEAPFLQKHLNLWTNASQQWMSPLDWAACRDNGLDWAEFEGRECIVGVDLATKHDLAAMVAIYPVREGDFTYLYVRATGYLPADTVEASKIAAMPVWVNSGGLKVAGVKTTDFDTIEADIVALGNEGRILDVAYDPWQALNLASRLEKVHGIPVIELRPTVANFSPAMKELDAMVREGRVRHDGNPVLAYCLACVEVQEDQKGNIFPRKNKHDSAARIDLAVALITAVSRWMVLTADGMADPEAMIS